MIKLAKKIYSNTSSKILRKFYYSVFCRLVRNRKICTSIDGINYRLDLGETIDICLYLGKYESEVVAAIQKICKPGHIVFDIGANIGAHALRFAKMAGENGKVYAFEPMDYAYQKLSYNISLNAFKNITPIQIVLSDKNLPRQRVDFRSSWPTSGKPINQENVVDFVKLDDWYKKENIKQVDLIKLDVDGNEYAVIKGAESLLANARPPIIMEVWGPNFKDDSKNPFILLQSLGYKFFDINTGEEYKTIENLRDRVSSNSKLIDISFNIIARH